MSVDNFPDKIKSKLRIKYPDGFEIEIEGDPQFIITQKNELLANAGKLAQEPPQPTNIKEKLSKIIDFRENIPYIRIKIPELDDKMALLVILLAFRVLLHLENPKALYISRALKLSGYNPKRIDIITNILIKDGSVSAFGTKRNRTYSLTEKGTAKAQIKVMNLIINL